MVAILMAFLGLTIPSWLSRPNGFHAEASPSAAISGYDAIQDRGKRKSIDIDQRSEDRVLNVGERAKLTANARDIARNYALAAWAIRRHLDYVSTFGFQCQTDDQGFNTELEAMVDEHDKRIDVAGRHRFSKIVRMLEAGAVRDGDCGLLLIDRGDGFVQGIEGDRIRDRIGSNGEPWLHGVKTDSAGRALRYAIHKRTNSGLTFEREVDARWMLLRGYFDRFDQTRGISPLASGLNSLRDTYENVDYALAKMKISQLLGFKVTRDGTGHFADTEVEAEEELDEDGNPVAADPKYKIDFGRGPVFLDMDPGENADFINVATPTNEFKEFMLAVIQLTLKSLDLPYSFYDESHTNFFGSVGAINHYKRSAADKIADNQALLDKEKQWRFGIWVRDGKLKLPAGRSLDRPFWKHVSMGMPWWKPTEEIAGVGAACGMGLDNPQNACEEHGTDYHSNVDTLARNLQYWQDKIEKPFGLKIAFAPNMPQQQAATTGNVIQKQDDQEDA